MSKHIIRVKMLSRCPPTTWLRQLPLGNPTWGNCKFIFDSNERDYDWLVVYDELSCNKASGNDSGYERLSCPQKNTLLITTEPSTIKLYHKSYTEQFEWVLTSQPEWALRHSGRIYAQPCLRWFYGAELDLNFDHLKRHQSFIKTETISTVLSNKKQRHTLHHRRFHFINELRQNLTELDIFGRGIRPINDKSEALNKYKYHIVVENFKGLHHWTEKLSDAFLAECLPFYAGCQNATDYFPSKSFIPIDIYDAKASSEIISKAIKHEEYQRRLLHIKEARLRVLHQYNIFAVLSDIIESRHSGKEVTRESILIKNRKILRRNPLVAIHSAYLKSTNRMRHWIRD
ncbi:MAG: glycosyltransferase family 10 [Verrucomicrobiota bacterium]|nr:glycosyltransferase family 10 [Verrucomicrobiota bacterium]